MLAAPSSIKITSWKDLNEKSSANDYSKVTKNLFELQDQVCTKQLHLTLDANFDRQVEKHKQSMVWQRVFPSCSEGNAVRKKKSGLKFLFSASAKFVRVGFSCSLFD